MDRELDQKTKADAEKNRDASNRTTPANTGRTSENPAPSKGGEDTNR